MRNTFTTLMRRLSQAGFNKDFLFSAILPDWWDEVCAQDPSLLPDIEIRVARFLGLPLSTVRSGGMPLNAPLYPGARLRSVRDFDRDRLAPAIHSAKQIAAAVVRSLRVPAPDPIVPPPNGSVWREEIRRGRATVTLDDILGNLWLRGIPIVPLDVLPAPSFQGAAFMVEGRPVIVLGHKHDQPGRVAFLVAHEAGHIAASDCTLDQPVIDEEDEVMDDDDMDQTADRYATRVLVGDDSVLPVDNVNLNFKELAKNASRLERTNGSDASFIIFEWASRTGDYAKASMAVNALYRGSGARRRLRQHFDRHVDLDAATESDRALLRCAYGEPGRDAAGL